MKIICSLFFTLITSSVFANLFHVEPTDSIRLIPEGSVIKFTRDFNIKPQTYEHLLGNSQEASCYLYVKKTSPKDRVIKAGTTFEIKFFNMKYPRLVVPGSDKIEIIYCKVLSTDNWDMTIQQFTDAIANTAKLIMSEPEEF